MTFPAYWLVLFVLGPSSRALWAGPPFYTDDPHPLLLHQWEFFLASQDTFARDAISGTAPHLEINYGPSPGVMMHVIIPLNYAKPRGGEVQWGPGDVELGFICRLIRQKGSRPEIGVFPHLELPTGSQPHGLGNGRPQLFLPVWIMQTWRAWKTYGGGGFWVNPGPGNKNYWSLGWVLQRAVSKLVAIGAEVFRNTPSRVGESGRTAFNVGTVLRITDGHELMFSAGRDIRGPNHFSMYIGYHWIIDPRE